jgi:hypothetical protein
MPWLTAYMTALHVCRTSPAPVLLTSTAKPVSGSPVLSLESPPHCAFPLAEFSYQPGDWLVFGAETSGLPPEAHTDVVAAGGCLVKIAIRDTHVRSINLSVAVGVGLFEAVRQLDLNREEGEWRAG